MTRLLGALQVYDILRRYHPGQSRLWLAWQAWMCVGILRRFRAEWMARTPWHEGKQ